MSKEEGDGLEENSAIIQGLQSFQISERTETICPEPLPREINKDQQRKGLTSIKDFAKLFELCLADL